MASSLTPCVVQSCRTPWLLGFPKEELQRMYKQGCVARKCLRSTPLPCDQGTEACPGLVLVRGRHRATHPHLSTIDAPI